MAMKFLGGGFVPSYPARDLTDAEVEEFGKENLLATGLYEEVPDAATEEAFQEQDGDQ
jgi:hypothetical protein